jgi:hypothetical protein
MNKDVLFSKLRNWFAKARIPLLVLLTIADIGLVWKYQDDNRYLYNFSKQFIEETDLLSEKVIKSVEFIRANLRTKEEPRAFLLPVFGFLSPPPREVADRGGDCADRSRLLITLLNLHGIKASKVALYDGEGIPRHAVVSAKVENNQVMVADAVYGIYFPKPEGGYYSVNDLKLDEGILRHRVEEMVAWGSDGQRPRMENYPYEKYTYRRPRTINWDKSIPMKLIYNGLKLIIGDKVDHIERPSFVERPALMLLYACIGLQLMLLLTYIPPVNRFLVR